jgi:hypothetical protein
MSISDIPPRGICYYSKTRPALNPCLVLGPERSYGTTSNTVKDHFPESTSKSSSQYGSISPEITTNQPGSFKRLNMLRALLNLQPFDTVIDEMGDLRDEVFKLIAQTKRCTWRVDGNWTTLGLCCPDATATFNTFDCLLKMCPASMAWVFSLQFKAEIFCEDGQSKHREEFSINTLQVDCSVVESTCWEGCLRKHLQRMHTQCSTAANVLLELKTAPLALSVVVQNPNNQCKQLKLDLSQVFDKSPCNQTAYKLMSVCSKGKNTVLWDAHCRYPNGENFRTFATNMGAAWQTSYDWSNTKKLFGSAKVLHLFYVNKTCLGQAHTAGIPNYSMHLYQGCWIECFFRDQEKYGLATDKFAAQLIKKRPYSDTFLIQWDDHDHRDRIKNHDEIWPLFEAQGESKFKIGMHVIVQHMKRWLGAVICKCFQDERYLVEYKGNVQTYRVRYASEIKLADAETDLRKDARSNSRNSDRSKRAGDHSSGSINFVVTVNIFLEN